MAQSNNTLSHIQQAVCDFRDARNWRQFHSPKNLSMSIAIEAAELMEHFQWLTVEQANLVARQEPEARQEILDELADILIYCFSLADVLNCEIDDIIFTKLAKNNIKYPAERFQGKF